ncbi:uncharacterized protein J8A68_005371 [[Candida] subhashii]|uniref:RNA polymerase II assembly factor Rtp1 C-terminal domain-containing protein n=1 Tax=[Candida] subhashii TaxID=561895 RepID=A0A8J5QFI0_9ASCO|nr:uncharacterized protein J8A68_005371 [[Candida] subhashii]KAG7661134.1 hypothetical protein J8A68_005371 [[Candida] subhashii]
MVSPKIEVVKDEPAKIESKSKQNPFEPRKKNTTIRRSANEVYSQRKGLNKPEIISNKPIDILFTKLEKILDLSYSELSIDLLYKRLFPDGPDGKDEFEKRYRTVSKLLELLIDIQKFSSESDGTKDKSVISISLHDMKTFGKLINVIIIHGIYPVLASLNIGVPFEKRRLKDFSNKKDQIKIDKLPIKGSYENHEKLLGLVYDRFLQLFQVKSDVTDLLSRGTGYADFITVSIALITVPHFDSKRKQDVCSQYDNSIQKIPETYELFQIYTVLMATPSPMYFKQFVIRRLQSLHYDAPRNDGLLSLIEFVLELRETEEVNIEKFDHVANVVLSKPSGVDTRKYFTSIGNQSYELLVNINRPTVTSCVVYAIEKLWIRNKRVTQDFILKKIWNCFNPEARDEPILITETQLNNTVNVLISLNKKTLDLDLYAAIFEPILLSLWGYYLFLKKHDKSTGVIMGILTSYFTIMKDYNTGNGLEIIAKNLIYDGNDNWVFEFGPNSMTQIASRVSEVSSVSKEVRVARFISGLDSACEAFIRLLEDLDDELVQSLFIKILKNWLNGIELIGEEKNAFLALMDLRLLESIGNKFKECLARTPIEMLEMVDSFLVFSRTRTGDSISNEDENSDDEDEEEDIREEVLPTLLELLSAILSENDGMMGNAEHLQVLTSVSTSLMKLSEKGDIKETTKRSALALNSRVQELLKGEPRDKDKTDTDRDILNRAIVSLNDPLVPIRAHGLYLLRKLVEIKSKTISIDFVINLHLVQLKDPDPFIYLNVIKGLEILISWDEYTVLEILCKFYKDENSEMDERLRIGEVLLRYIQSSNDAFGGKSASLIVETTLSLIRRSKDENNVVDDRLRMSSMSLLGSCCKVNPLGMIDKLEECLDCAIGILQLETSVESAIMRRAAIVLIHDLILGTSETNKVMFPKRYQESVFRILRYVSETDNDLLAREQAQRVLKTISELTEAAMELYREQLPSETVHR